MPISSLFKRKKKPLPTPSIPQAKAGETIAKGIISVQDVIAPPAIEVDFNHLKIGNSYFRTLFISGYPRYVSANWLAPLINFDHTLDISMFVYPIEGGVPAVIDQVLLRVVHSTGRLSRVLSGKKLPGFHNNTRRGDYLVAE